MGNINDGSQNGAANSAKRDHSQLILETLESLMDYLPRLRRGLQSIAEALQEGSVQPDTTRRLTEATEGLQWVLDALTGVHALLGDELEEAADWNLSADLETIRTLLEYVISSLEENDALSFADTLGHELPDLLAEWDAPVARLYEHIRRRCHAS